MHILRMVVEKLAEWEEELWIEALDVQKTIDRIHHSDMSTAFIKKRLNVNVLAL